MTLNNFSGGLNTRLSPNLIKTSESVICENVDLDSGVIKPLKGLKATASMIPIGEDNFTIFKGTYISDDLSSSFVEFNDKLYYTNSTDSVQKSTDGISFYELGLNAPSSIPITNTSFTAPIFTISNSSTGSTTNTLVTGTTYNYKIEYRTITGAIVYEDKIFTYTGSNGIDISINSFDNLTSVAVYRLYSSKYRLIAEGTARPTITDEILNISSSTSISTYDDYIPTLNYVYTYYSSTTSFESAPSSASEDLEVKANYNTISGLVASSDTSVNTINIYRLGNTLTSYYLVASITNGTTSYIDTKTDLDILDTGTLLETSGYIRPPDGIKFLTEYNSALFACIDSTLYFSQAGLVDIWTDFNYIVFPEHITGLGVTQNGLLIFSRNKTWILVGTDLSSYSKYLLNGSQGCISNTTVSYVDNLLLWQSLDGICTSSGSTVELLTWNNLGKVSFEPIKAVVYENQYMLFHTEGIFVIDFRNGVKFYTLDIIARGAYYSSRYDKLYVLQPDNLGIYEYNEDTNLTYKYKTGWLAENGITNYKTYKNIYIYSTGTNSLNVYIDKILTNSVTLKEGLNDIKVLQTKQKGYFIELEFTGTGSIIELNMNFEGRQNGR